MEAETVETRRTEWHKVEMPGNGNLFVRTVDKTIMKAMPTKTETFIERSSLKLFVDRMKNFIVNGK